MAGTGTPPPPLVLLHGFTGSPESWADVRSHLGGRAVFAPALLGHDGSSGPATVQSFADEVDRLAAAVRSRRLARAHLAGYSLGGRVALGLLVRHPSLFSRATIVGASPGLTTAADRESRRRQDEEWARLLETRGLPTFVAAWEALPLFAPQERVGDGVLERQRRIRLSHDPRGLARALRVLGLAAMPDYGQDLETIDLPVRVVAGARDDKFAALARRMAQRLPRSRLHVLGDTGHNVILERPDEVAGLLKELES